MTVEAWPALDGTVRCVARQLPQAIADDAARARLEAVATQLPASLSNCLYFEAPLSAASQRVDFIVRVDAAERALLANLAPRPDHAGHRIPVAQRHIWSRVHRLAAEWSGPDSLMAESVRTVWLEFDVDPVATGMREPAAPIPPSVFVDFATAASRHRSRGRRFEMVAAAIAPLVDRPVLHHRLASIERCVHALPAAWTVVSVGVLLPRGGSTVRLCVLGGSGSDLEHLLDAVGWPGDVAWLRSLRRSLGACGADAEPPVTLVHFDIGSSMEPRLGIEHRFERRLQTRGVIREASFLDRLVDCGLCSAEKRDALLAWPGCSPARLPHELWESVASRRVNHVKLMCDDAGGWSAKAYLTVGHAFRAQRGAIGSPGTYAVRRRASTQ